MKNLSKMMLVVLIAVIFSFLTGEVKSQGAAGTIKGSVKFAGTPPAMAPLKRSADPFCGKTPMKDQTVITNANGTLQNVAVRITGSVAGANAAPAATPCMTLDQANCMYTPRVLALAPKQKLCVKNSDPVLHNVHCYSGTTTCFNRAQPKGSKDIEQELAAGVYKMKCDVHPWMTGYVVMNENPFVTVTGETGSFSLANLPAGSYTVEAWHEKYGTKTAQVTVTAGAEATADFTFEMK